MSEIISRSRPVLSMSQRELSEKQIRMASTYPLTSRLNVSDNRAQSSLFNADSAGDSVHFSGKDNRKRARPSLKPNDNPPEPPEDPIDSDSEDDQFPSRNPLSGKDNRKRARPSLKPNDNPPEPPEDPIDSDSEDDQFPSHNPFNSLVQLLTGGAGVQPKGPRVAPSMLMQKNIQSLEAKNSDWKAYRAVAEPFAHQLADILDRTHLKHVVLQGNNEQLQQAIMMTLKENAKDKSFYKVDASHDSLDGIKRFYRGPALANELTRPAAEFGLSSEKPTVLYVQNVDDERELNALKDGALFQRIQDENPHYRFIIAQPEEDHHEHGADEHSEILSLGKIMLIPNGEQETLPVSKEKAPFDVIKVPQLTTSQWATVLPQDPVVQGIFKHRKLAFTPDTLKLFLDGLPGQKKKPLDRDSILTHLEHFGSFVRNSKSGKLSQSDIEAFHKKVNPQALILSGKRPALSAEPKDQKPYKIIKASDINTRLDDVVGLEEAKVTLNRVLKKARFPRFNSFLSKNDTDSQTDRVLLMGEPGGGKTMLAKAMAGQGKATFISTSGSQFVNIYVGMGANNMRQLQDAINHATEDLVVVFMDEIDSLGNRESGSGLGGGGAREETQTINQFLALTEGIEKDKKKVLLIGATNRPEALDPAILSRFHHKIQVGKLTAPQRKLLLEKQMAQKMLKPDKSVDLDEVVKETNGFSGRDIRNVMKLSQEMLIDQLPITEMEELEKNPPLLKNFKLTLTADVLEQAIHDVKKGWADVHKGLTEKPMSDEVRMSMYT